MKKSTFESILESIEFILAQLRRTRGYTHLITEVKRLSIGLLKELRRVTPKIAKAIQKQLGANPDETAVLLIVGGVTAVICANKLLIFGTLNLKVAAVIAVASAATLSPQFAPLAFIGVALGTFWTLVGVIGVVVATVAAAFGFIRLLKSIAGRFRDWWKRANPDPIPRLTVVAA
jgi:hypothetical protein